MSFKWYIEPRTLLYGQFISCLITGTGIFASLLTRSAQHANNPMFLATMNYALLALYFNGKRARSGTLFGPINSPWYWYLIVAFLDVEANVLVTTAYQYTSITSVMLLDCFSIPCTMLLSHFALGARYSWWHVAGVLVCVLGLGLTVYSDLLEESMRSGDDDDSQRPPHPLLGDLLCIVGALCYSCSNVFQEVMVKGRQRTEYLSLIGGFGACIGAAQTVLWERHDLAGLHWTPPIALCSAGFVGCLFLIYCNASEFLKVGDAPLFNLSLLTSDVYAVAFAYLAFGQQVHWLYYVAFVVTAAGICMYHCAAPLPTSSLVTFHPNGSGSATGGGSNSGSGAGSCSVSGSGVGGMKLFARDKETVPLNRDANGNGEMHYNVIRPDNAGRAGFVFSANSESSRQAKAPAYVLSQSARQDPPRGGGDGEGNNSHSRYTFISEISVGDSLMDEDDYDDPNDDAVGNNDHAGAAATAHVNTHAHAQPVYNALRSNDAEEGERGSDGAV